MDTPLAPGPRFESGGWQGSWWVYRLHYFFAFGALGALFPFLPLLLDERGLSPRQIGWIMVAIPVTNIALPPAWGALADAARARVRILGLATAGCALTVLALAPEWGFIGSAVALAVYCVFRAPLSSLADAVTHSALGPQGDRFSRIRVWGSVGFALFALVVGWLGGSQHPVRLILVTSVIYLGATVVTFPMGRSQPSYRRAAPGAVKKLLADGPMVVFLLASACYYAGQGCYDALFGLYARSLGYSDRFVGFAWTIGVTVEVLVMLVAPPLLRRSRASVLLALCGFTAAIRWALLSWFESAVALALVQVLHGVTFGLWYLSLVRFVQTRAPEPIRATAQSVAMAAVACGMTFAYVVGSTLFEMIDGKAVYVMASAMATIAGLLYVLVFRLTRRAARSAGS